MPISHRSAKAKGHNFQNWVRDKILELWPRLKPEDVRSTSSGSNGVDVQLSPAASKLFKYKVEAKALKKVSIYRAYEQACRHKAIGEPVVFIKENRKEPLVVISASHFFELIREK